VQDVVVKKGYLAKRGRHDPRYTRYHCELKDGAVRFYDNASQIYTPKGSIDLRFSISAMLDPDSKKPKDEVVHIKLVNRAREYWLKADSPQEARDWVKQLQRMIFKCHNDGDSVKICIRIEDIVDLEESQFLDVSDTVKIKVSDQNETYAVDDVSIPISP
jgi:sterol 3beta-glucosyltransferase